MTKTEMICRFLSFALIVYAIICVFNPDYAEPVARGFGVLFNVLTLVGI